MGDGRRSDAEDESWTDLEDVQLDFVEVTPVRHGMVLGGRYAVERIIGRGGAGVVVRAHDRDLREVVAIKIVRAELAGQRVWAERLAREVKLARQIHHPHVCRVFDFQQGDGRVFLVMELAENGTLRDEIQSGALAARPLAARIADARAVASALEAIHKAGIVHRDLSPQNLLRMGDGRLVLSDFGLATDVSEGTSSIHGGTVTYMAPEVVRGGRSSVASDVWALGVVMHEIVFAEKPRWSEAASPEMLAPALGRPLTKEERAVLDTCRACTVKEQARRIESAREAGRRLTESRAWWRPRLVSLRRPLIFAGTLTLLAAVTVGLLRARQAPVAAPAASAQESPLIVLTGEPADWTDISTVLVEVPDRIQCTRLLPDQRTIRFVWGTPPRAEDIDTVTRKRVPSPLVTEAYAEGCPDLSPDGKRLVFQGHAPDGRAVAFLSQRSDGKDAVPVVQTAEPTMSSEPTWLSDSHTFSYDVDTKHMGVFLTEANRMRVLPEVTPKPFFTAFRSVIGDLIFVSTVFDTGVTEVTGVAMPTMKEEVKFRLPEFAVDLRKAGQLLYYTTHSPGKSGELIEVDVAHNQGRRLGTVRKQIIRYPTVMRSGIAFVGIHFTSTAALQGSDGAIREWDTDGRIFSVARCGQEFVVARERGDRVIVERVDSGGRLIRTMTNGPWDADPVCSSDGGVLYYSRQKGGPTIVRCDKTGCVTIGNRPAYRLSISPDGKRLAAITVDRRGAIVEVMRSDGSDVRELMESETGCATGWASNETLWVSRRRAGKIIWVEISAESGRETGHFVPGSRDCADGKPDPQSPVQPDLRVVYKQTAQLRFLGKEHLRWQ